MGSMYIAIYYYTEWTLNYRTIPKDVGRAILLRKFMSHGQDRDGVLVSAPIGREEKAMERALF